MLVHLGLFDSGLWTKMMKSGVLVFIGGCNKSLEALDDLHYLYTEHEYQRSEKNAERMLERAWVEARDAALMEALNKSKRKGLEFASSAKTLIAQESPNDRWTETEIATKMG